MHIALSGVLCGALGFAGSLLDAVKAGNLPAVQKTLDQRGNPNEADLDEPRRCIGE